VNRRAWSSRWWGRGAVIAAALLMLAVALCFFDTDRDGVDDPGSGLDLCNVSLLIATVVIGLGRPTLAGRWRNEVIPSLYAVALPRLDPPPKAVSLS